jgi:general stress protein YciG
MPKPVKKAPKKPAAKKRQSSDPNVRAHQMMAEMEAKQATGPQSGESVTPPHGDPFEEQFKARMSELGRKGGKASGAKRMEMPEKQRQDIATKAAQARWKKKPTQS